MGDQNNHDRSNCEQCLRDDLEAANEEIAELTEQRDELLRVLRLVADPDTRYDATQFCSGLEYLRKIAREAIAKAEKKMTPCGKKLAAGQWWQWCGETDMGQTAPALCIECDKERGFLLEGATKQEVDARLKAIHEAIEKAEK